MDTVMIDRNDGQLQDAHVCTRPFSSRRAIVTTPLADGEVTVEEDKKQAAGTPTRKRSASLGGSALGGAGTRKIKADEDGIERTVLTRLYPGCHFGELSLVREQPRNASVIARGGDVVTRYLDRASFQALVAEDGEFWLGLAQHRRPRL